MPWRRRRSSACWLLSEGGPDDLTLPAVGATLVVARFAQTRPPITGATTRSPLPEEPQAHAVLMPSCINGIERSRLPVAAKIALSTAGAATDTVGSPTPPQKPPEGMTMTSTLGISRIRSEL